MSLVSSGVKSWGHDGIPEGVRSHCVGSVATNYDGRHHHHHHHQHQHHDIETSRISIKRKAELKPRAFCVSPRIHTLAVPSPIHKMMYLHDKDSRSKAIEDSASKSMAGKDEEKASKLKNKMWWDGWRVDRGVCPAIRCWAERHVDCAGSRNPLDFSLKSYDHKFSENTYDHKSYDQMVTRNSQKYSHVPVAGGETGLRWTFQNFLKSYDHKEILGSQWNPMITRKSYDHKEILWSDCDKKLLSISCGTPCFVQDSLTSY